MASNPSVKMDVDNPLVLKRSNSAPMINQLNNSMTSETSATATRLTWLQHWLTVTREREAAFGTGPICRPRRFSTSFSPLAVPEGGQLSPRLGQPRVHQLRREESVDLLGREAAHERALHTSMAMSQSWEDLTLVKEPLTVSVSGGSSSGAASPSAPSPLRPSPAFSPSLFKSSLSPSPTRKFATRRSQSPIAMRPSSLGPVKRKFELEDQVPPAKRGGLLFLHSRSQSASERMSSESDSTSSDFDSLLDQPMSLQAAPAEPPKTD